MNDHDCDWEGVLTILDNGYPGCEIWAAKRQGKPKAGESVVLETRPGVLGKAFVGEVLGVVDLRDVRVYACSMTLWIPI